MITKDISKVVEEKVAEFERYESEAWYHGYKVGKNTGYVEGRKAHHAHQWNKLMVTVFTAAFIGISLALFLFR